jgi:hypothetical protein
LFEWDYRKLCGGTEGAIGLGSVTPHGTPQPLRRNAVAYSIYMSGSITVRDDARIRHAVAKRILAFLDVARVDSGCSDPNTNLT